MLPAAQPRPKGENMPAPQRKRKKEHRYSMSVYPPARTGITLGGYRSIPFTQAVRCWAKLIETASVEVEEMFTPKEWNYLAQACLDVEFEFDPERDKPSDALAERVERAANYKVATDLLDKSKGLSLAERVRELDYTHSWAVIWALQYRVDYALDSKPGEPWWTLGHRTSTLVKIKKEEDA
jgi:hypothetical protein